MYTLILTRPERKALDWVGHRYSHGNDLIDVLCQCQTDDGVGGPDPDWSHHDGPITFYVPENLAWEAEDLIGQDDCACLGSELKAKLHAFCDAIV